MQKKKNPLKSSGINIWAELLWAFKSIIKKPETCWLGNGYCLTCTDSQKVLKCDIRSHMIHSAEAASWRMLRRPYIYKPLVHQRSLPQHWKMPRGPRQGETVECLELRQSAFVGMQHFCAGKGILVWKIKSLTVGAHAHTHTNHHSYLMCESTAHSTEQSSWEPPGL